MQVTTQPSMGTITGSIHAPLLFLFTICCLREACSPAIHAAPRWGWGGGLPGGRPGDDSHSFSLVESSLLKALAGEGAKFKVRLPEKITCHVKITAIS